MNFPLNGYVTAALTTLLLAFGTSACSLAPEDLEPPVEAARLAATSPSPTWPEINPCVALGGRKKNATPSGCGVRPGVACPVGMACGEVMLPGAGWPTCQCVFSRP